MPTKLTISVDAMGGDDAPEMVIEGLDLICRDLAGVRFLLFGDEARIAPLLARHKAVAAVSELRHAPDVIGNDVKVATALRSGRNSSMRMAIEAVKSDEVSGVVSAGNTGALMALAKIVLRTMPGIERPAIATVLPTRRGACVMLDLGANVECDAHNLVQFAVIGEVFARQVLGLERPSVGLLNIGTEELKGNEEVKTAARILQQTHLPIKFYGFVEGDDIGAGTVDVVVTDGFTGNVALKTAEGTAKMLGQFLREELTGSMLAKLGYLLVRPALSRFRDRVDPRRYNGAMLLGLNGICVKSHGGTDAFGFANAVRVTADLIRKDFNDRIREDLNDLAEAEAKAKLEIAAAAAVAAAEGGNGNGDSITVAD